MYELLNKYGLPDDFGFIICLDTFSQLFDSKEDYLNFGKKIINRIEYIKEHYNINSINLAFKISLVIQSVDGGKKIVLNKDDLINSIENYFTNGLASTLSEREYTDTHEPLSSIFGIFTIMDKNDFYAEKTLENVFRELIYNSNVIITKHEINILKVQFISLGLLEIALIKIQSSQPSPHWRLTPKGNKVMCKLVSVKNTKRL